MLGARSYVREGRHAIFEKLIRDIRAVALLHADTAACRATLVPQLSRLAAEWDRLARRCRELPAPERLKEVPGELCDLADRYVVLLAGAACAGVWRRQASGVTAAPIPPEWITVVLARLEARLGLPGAAAVTEEAEAVLAAELSRRFDDRLTFDLDARRLAG